MAMKKVDPKTPLQQYSTQLKASAVYRLLSLQSTDFTPSPVVYGSRLMASWAVDIRSCRRQSIGAHSLRFRLESFVSMCFVGCACLSLVLLFIDITVVLFRRLHGNIIVVLLICTHLGTCVLKNPDQRPSSELVPDK